MLLKTAIGHALRANRESQGLTLRAVTSRAFVALGYLSEVERGQKEVSSEMLDSLAHALGLNTSDIVREACDIMILEEHLALSLSK